MPRLYDPSNVQTPGPLSAAIPEGFRGRGAKRERNHQRRGRFNGLFRQASRRLRITARPLPWLKAVVSKAGEPALDKFRIAPDPRPRKAGAKTLRKRPLKAA